MFIQSDKKLTGMVVAEVCEDSRGIKEESIQYLVKKYKLTRNNAIKNLKATNGSVLDAFVKIENRKINS